MTISISKEGCSVYPITVPTKSGLESFNFYLLEDNDSLSLIDAGVDTEKCWELFIRTLTKNGFAIDDLSRILLTHNHSDHVGLVNRITSLKELPVYAHEESIHRLKRDKAFFSMRIRFFEQLYQEMGCGTAGEQQVRKLEEAARKNEKFKIRADILPLTDFDTVAGLKVIETPGHSHDHVVFLDEGRNWLFVGDHVLRHISSNALTEPDQEGRRIMALIEYADSLKKCLKLNAETLYTGHGELINNPKDLITTRLKRIDEKAEKMLDLIKGGLSIPNELAQAYYRNKYQSEFSLVMSEVIGHLDYLEIQHKVQKERKDGVWHYYPTFACERLRHA
jgi:glyoxylase-like metal-dependent hydrolase (beta-lactamase superfamily II)